jgi:Arc/MetJ family transcription regulator
MSRTLIDTDDELLDAAREVLGTRTKRDTVNAALAEVVKTAARRRLLDAAKSGAFDGVARGDGWR